MDPQTPPLSPRSGHAPLQPVEGAAAATDATLSEALITLRKRKAVIILALLLGIAFGYYKGVSQIHMFEAYGRIEIRSGSANQYRVGAADLTGAGSSHMPTEVAIIQSDTLMLAVAKELDLANNKDFFGSKTPVHHDINDPRQRQDVVARLESNFHVIVVPKTDIIRLSYDALDPNLAALVVNTVIKQYIDHTLSARIEASERISGKLSEKLNDLKLQVESSQQKMLDLSKRLGVLGFDQNHNLITANLEDLAKASATAEVARILAESRYRVISNADPSTIDSMIDSTPGVQQSALTSLRTQLTTQQASYANLLGTLGPNHPLAVSARKQIEDLQRAVDKEQKRLIAQARDTYTAARANEQQTNAALDSQKTDAYKLRDDIIAYTLRQRDFESARTLYEGLLQRIRTAGVQAGLESQEIDIVDAAFPPSYPTLQPRSSLLILYSSIGLVIGVILAFLLESLDTGLRNIAEIESVTGLASLALIPRARRSADQATLTPVQRNLQVLGNPKSQFSESFRALRTSLLLSTAGHPPQVVVLTSATPAEGKTTISTNLSCVLAQRDVRVLLIDADLRRPTVHHRFGLNGRVGLTTILTGACAPEQAIQKIADLPNLDILASGPVPPFPTEMLGSQTMLDLLAGFRKTYTHIVIDSPPLLSVTDGVVLARESDAVVLIVRHGKSSKHIVRRARDLLLRAGAPLMGLVLNAVDLNSPEYYGYYGYSGYSYAGVDTQSWESKKKKDDDANDNTEDRA